MRVKFLKINYKQIHKFLNTHSIKCKSILKDDIFFDGLHSILNSSENDLTFFSNNKFKLNLSNTNALACLIKQDDILLLPKSCIPIIVENPYQAFAHLTNLFSPPLKSNKTISKFCSLNQSANLGRDIQIGDFVSIKENTSIGDNCIIFDNCVIGPNVTLGSNTIIYPNNTLSNLIIGHSSSIQSSCSIGDQGFGFFSDDRTSIQHIGNVIIGKNSNIGSNCTIDRGTIDSTILGDNVRIDNLVHIAHNVQIGNGTIIAGQTGIAGGAYIGQNCIIGGQVGINGHINIGNNVTIAAKSGVTKNISDNLTIAGFPAIDIRRWRKSIINKKRDTRDTND